MPDTWRIPSSIPLLSVDDNKEGEAWSWYIRYGTLHYLDEDLNEHELEPDIPTTDAPYDREPEDIEEDEDDEESDDDE